MKQRDQYHDPVLANEVVEVLCHRKQGIFVDGTLGGGGHFRTLAMHLEKGATLIGIDRDPDALAWNLHNTAVSGISTYFEHARFSKCRDVVTKCGFSTVDGILLDLGVSSFQIDTAERGFSFMHPADLDMRMNPQEGIPASELIATASVDELAHYLAAYGEVRNAQRMALVLKNTAQPLLTSSDLRDCLAQEYGPHLKFKVLAKIFQALRIAVNEELAELQTFLSTVVDLLSEGGRFAIISYHSLEDRMVKEFIREHEHRCVCQPGALMCTCGEPGSLKRITKKPLMSSSVEVEQNPRARSARLRVAEKFTKVAA